MKWLGIFAASISAGLAMGTAIRGLIDLYYQSCKLHPKPKCTCEFCTNFRKRKGMK